MRDMQALLEESCAKDGPGPMADLIIDQETGETTFASDAQQLGARKGGRKVRRE